MNTLMDEETVVLEALDFDVPCRYGSHAAVVSITCRGCGRGALFCGGHAEYVRAEVERMIAASAALAVTCGHCRRVAYTFDELVVVIPL